MLWRSYGFKVTQIERSGIRIPLAIRQNETRFRRNLHFTKSPLIVSRNGLLPFSTVTGSSLLRLQDPWLPWLKRQSHLIPSADDSQSTTSRTWITISPTSPAAQGVLDRIVRWLRICWKRILRLSFLAVRTGEVILHLSPLIILAPASFVSNRVLESSAVSDITWNYLIKAIQGLGPVAVKFCQWAATRRDIFPPSLCDHLSILHDKGYPHSLRWTRQVLTEAFGDYQRKGLIIEDAIGCGAAAQVYRGKLAVKTDSTEPENKEPAREVAIKVLHPRFREMVDRDLDFLEIISDFAHSLPITYIKMLNIPRAFEEFSVVLRDQVDLTIEAENLRQLRKNFYKNSQEKEEKSSIIFPKPIDGWIAPHAIVEEYVSDAVPIANYLLDSSQDGMAIRKELAAPLLRAFLKMVFIDNFIHGDLHPGNVLVKTTLVPEAPSAWSFLSAFDTTKKEQRPKENKIKRSIVFLDAGIVVSLSPNHKKDLFDLFRAVVFNDGFQAGSLMIERNKNNERCRQSPSSVDEFAKGIEEIVSEFHNRRKEGLTLGAVRIGVLLHRVLDLCRIHGVEIDPAMASVVISTLVLEGLGRSLSPDLDLLTFARPFLLRGSV